MSSSTSDNDGIGGRMNGKKTRSSVPLGPSDSPCVWMLLPLSDFLSAAFGDTDASEAFAAGWAVSPETTGSIAWASFVQASRCRISPIELPWDLAPDDLWLA